MSYTLHVYKRKWHHWSIKSWFRCAERAIKGIDPVCWRWRLKGLKVTNTSVVGGSRRKSGLRGEARRLISIPRKHTGKSWNEQERACPALATSFHLNFLFWDCFLWLFCFYSQQSAGHLHRVLKAAGLQLHGFTIQTSAVWWHQRQPTRWPSGGVRHHIQSPHSFQTH